MNTLEYIQISNQQLKIDIYICEAKHDFYSQLHYELIFLVVLYTLKLRIRYLSFNRMKDLKRKCNCSILPIILNLNYNSKTSILFYSCINIK